MQTIEIKKSSDEAKKERTYPYMGMAKDGDITWFGAPKTGIAIKSRYSINMRAMDNSWIESSFTPMQGDYKFTFKND